MYDFREMERDLWGYYSRDGETYISGPYCYGAEVAEKMLLSLHQFTLYLLALKASAMEKYSTLFSVETNDGKMARRSAIRGEEFWWAQFQEALA